jgi:hypothetical protein
MQAIRMCGLKCSLLTAPQVQRYGSLEHCQMRENSVKFVSKGSEAFLSLFCLSHEYETIECVVPIYLSAGRSGLKSFKLSLSVSAFPIKPRRNL